jgi:hypothetical protein
MEQQGEGRRSSEPEYPRLMMPPASLAFKFHAVNLSSALLSKSAASRCSEAEGGEKKKEATICQRRVSRHQHEKN